ASNIPITNVFDVNKDGQVGSGDVLVSQGNETTNSTATIFINVPGAGPFAPPPDGAAPAGGGNGGAASALVSSASSPSPSLQTVPTWLVTRLSHVDLNSAPIAKYFEFLAQENTARDRAVLVKADQIADALNLDDELLDGLLVKLSP